MQAGVELKDEVFHHSGENIALGAFDWYFDNES